MLSHSEFGFFDVCTFSQSFRAVIVICVRFKEMARDPRFWYSAVFLALVVIFWLVQVPTLNQALVEMHGFRQTQTAYQSLTMSRGFGSLLHPKLPIFGSPWEVPFEFPLFQFSAALLIRYFSISSDVANRLASLVWFTLCLIPLWYLARRYLNALTALGVTAVFLFNPFALQWSRASLIEYCALFFGLCFVLFFLKYWDSLNLYWAVGASAAGSLTGLVKSTTLVAMIIFLVFLLPNFVGTLIHFRNNLRRIFYSSFVMTPVLVSTAWWTHHADEIKGSSPATAWLTSSELNQWNFGTLAQRLDFNNWIGIFGRIDSLLVPKFILLALFLLPIYFMKFTRITVASIGSIFLSIGVFFNLYQVHDYYLVALTPQVALLLVIAVHGLSASRQIFLVPSFVVAILFTSLLTLQQSTSYWKVSRQPLGYSHELATLTKPDQYIIFGFNTWDSTGLYYADRRGIMFDARGITTAEFAKLPDLNKYDFFHGPMERKDLIQIRGHYAPVGSATIRIDNRISDFGAVGVIFSSTAPDWKPRKIGEIACNGQDLFSFEQYPVDTVFKTTSNGDNFFQKAIGIIPVPVGSSATKVEKPVDAPPQTVSCVGNGTVTFSIPNDRK
jgi:hypothetical protein